MLIEKYKNLKKKIDSKKVIELLKESILKNDKDSFIHIFKNSGLYSSISLKLLINFSIKNKKYDFLELMIKDNSSIEQDFFKYLNQKEYYVILLYSNYNNNNKFKEILKNKLIDVLDSEENFFEIELIKLFIDNLEKFENLKIYFKELKDKNKKDYDKIFENKKYIKILIEKSINNF